MILVIDNYDSFTFNLVQMLAVAGEQVEVARNDSAPAGELLARQPLGIVLSPGPGRPERAGICIELIRRAAPVPLLGVCLGHQALAVAYGAEVDRAGRQMHGKTSHVRHDGRGVFAGLPNPFEATRYHSLAVRAESLPAELQATAWSEDDNEMMGLCHRQLPYFGVQFHPESVLTTVGPHLIANFLELCRRRRVNPALPARAEPRAPVGPSQPGGPSQLAEPFERAEPSV